MFALLSLVVYLHCYLQWNVCIAAFRGMFALMPLVECLHYCLQWNVCIAVYSGMFALLPSVECLHCCLQWNVCIADFSGMFALLSSAECLQCCVVLSSSVCRLVNVSWLAALITYCQKIRLFLQYTELSLRGFGVINDKVHLQFHCKFSFSCYYSCCFKSSVSPR